MDRALQQILRMVLNLGLRSGIDHLSRRGKKHQDMSAEERKQAQSTRRNLGNASRLARILGRLGR